MPMITMVTTLSGFKLERLLKISYRAPIVPPTHPAQFSKNLPEMVHMAKVRFVHVLLSNINLFHWISLQ